MTFDEPLGSRALTGRRWAPGAWVRGVFVNGEESAVKLTGSLQPAGPRELEQLEEGERVKDVRLFITQGAIRAGDEFDIDGEPYKVVKVPRYSLDGFTHHTEAILVMKDKPAAAPPDDEEPEVDP